MSGALKPAFVIEGGDPTTEFYLAPGLRKRLREAVRPHKADGRVFVVSDGNVGALYGDEIAAELGAPLLMLPSGEASKCWDSVERVVRWLVGYGVERRDVLLGVGGGVVTDLVGFAASIALRGIGWIAMPTSLLGMVDAAIGGKTGIDLDLGKNLVGTFWPPRAVAVDPEVLETLDGRQLRAGLAEVVKAGMIAPSTLVHVLDEHLAALASGRLERASELIRAAARAKADVVAIDSNEAGTRVSLNLGHTLGHALESATDYARFLHGEAVAWGLLAALRLARDRGLLSTAEAQAWAGRVQRLAPLPALTGMTWERLAPYARRDKKRRAGRVGWILPRDGGVVLGVQIPDEEIANVVECLQMLPAEGPFTQLL